MIGIFFIYGLAFFILGFSVLLYPKKRSTLTLASNLWLIAAFGISHGLNEWIDMFSLVHLPFPVVYLKVIRLLVLPVSFYFLVLFGVKNLHKLGKKHVLLNMLPVLLPLAWIFVTAASSDRFLTGDIMARYLLCIPGTILTSLAFISLLPELEKTNSPILIGSLKWVAGAFFIYGLFAGLMVPKSDFFPASFLNYSLFNHMADIPVQVPRALFAVVITVGILRVLTAFDWETNKALHDSEERYRILAEAARAEKALRQSEERLSIAREAAQIGVHDYDVVSGTIQWDERAREIWGIGPDEPVTSEVIMSGLHPDDRAPAQSVLDKALDPAGDGKYYAEYRVISRKDGIERWAAATGKAFFEKGRAIRLVCIVQDITERRRTEEEINELNKELAYHLKELDAANKELEAFIYSVSHDLRAPLRSIKGFSDFLINRYSHTLDAKGRQYLNWVVDSAAKMDHIIDDLLQLSRISRHDIHKQDVDMSKIARSVVAELIRGQPDRCVRIDIEEILTARADPRLIEIALSNLLGNAWKFTSKTDNARIEFGSFERDGKTVYYIKDNGAGFDQKFADRLFLPFQRLHSEQEFEGTGIGLAIVERVIRRHRGRIWAEGKPNEGAAFFFTLEEQEPRL